MPRGRAASVRSFVREQDSKALHAMAFRFRRLFETDALTDRQDWLWHQILDELQRRRAAQRPVWQRCTCDMCFIPFALYDVDEEPF